MLKLINGKAIADRIKDKVAQQINALKGPRPNLAIVLVGEREDSKLYVTLKEREAVGVGVDTHLYKLEASATEEEILSVINFLNDDEVVDAILIQLPLPGHLNTNKIIEAISPAKDVDGFHSLHPDFVVSPVLASVEACLDEIKFLADRKKACILYNSEIFGNTIREMLLKRGLEVVDRKRIEQADLVISALGEPHKIKKEMIKKDAVLIDIGITKLEGKVLGDVDFEDVKEKAAYLTPVPGGIGPMTIAYLFYNVWQIFKHKNKIS
ncbi:MAG: bifunctional 5,10-methylenetetrahydrofolate dehydrogenase/5,10-methenyltetrahydrofolate cyclohydrolase [Patescibacteria group bacterium]|nr:bifunctional 5,10-methylenetetrahydrofolate dehydrogenase/5,10-methenyltetrahydrofolate cyclohydrolase [Patescibacteria group bacterium]